MTGSVVQGPALSRVAESSSSAADILLQLDELRRDLSAALSAGLAHAATTSQQQLDEVVRGIEAALTERMDALAADLRRALASSSQVQVDSAVSTQAATLDARSALESRASIAEAALQALGERSEALHVEAKRAARNELQAAVATLNARASAEASAADARLRRLEEGVARLADRLGSLADEAAAREVRLQTAISDLAQASSAGARATTDAVSALAESVGRTDDAVQQLIDEQADARLEIATSAERVLTDVNAALETRLRSEFAQLTKASRASARATNDAMSALAEDVRHTIDAVQQLSDGQVAVRDEFAGTADRVLAEVREELQTVVAAVDRMARRAKTTAKPTTSVTAATSALDVISPVPVPVEPAPKARARTAPVSAAKPKPRVKARDVPVEPKPTAPGAAAARTRSSPPRKAAAPARASAPAVEPVAPAEPTPSADPALAGAPSEPVRSWSSLTHHPRTEPPAKVPRRSRVAPQEEDTLLPVRRRFGSRS